MNDSEFMRRALSLGRRGIGSTSPNPPVGAVVVKEGREIGAGWHRRAGSPHAEVEAIVAASRQHGDRAAEGATLYVTLEPCSTTGRTGPCTEVIIAHRLARVVIGAGDPNRAHSGRAAPILRAAGIQVEEGIEEANCQELIRSFAKVQGCGLPWVILKTAMSLDGRITRPAGEGQWLSSEASRLDVQHLRAEVDAILTSGKTVRTDDPRLTLRSLDARPIKRQPLRVVLTSREDGVPASSQVLNDEHAERTIVSVRRPIETVLRELVSEHGVNTVLVEAGGGLLGRFVDEGWADELVIYLAPLLTGGPVPAVGGEGAASLARRERLGVTDCRRIGRGDVRLRAVLTGTGGDLAR